MQSVRDILDIIKLKGHNVQEISRKTGIKADKIYKWLEGKGTPRHEDGEKIKEWANNNLEKIPKKRYEKNEDLTIVNERDAEYRRISREDKLLDLVKSQQESILLLSRQVDTMQKKISSLEGDGMGNVRHSG